jgi:hypothetical protein
MAKYSRRRTACFIFLTALARFALFPVQAAAAQDAPLDSLVLNDGSSLTLRVENSEPSRIRISSGEAHRVPRKERIPFDAGKNIVELDISTRVFALGTGAKQITLSGPTSARISGIDAASWGTDESPAVFMDRDCRLELAGKAATSAVIRVNPLARVTIDARKLSTPEIIIIGPQNNANVAAMPGTSVSFHRDNTQKRIVTMRGWYSGATTPAPSPPPPGVQQTQQGNPPPPPPAPPGAAPAAQTSQSQSGGQPAPPAIPGIAPTGTAPTGGSQ